MSSEAQLAPNDVAWKAVMDHLAKAGIKGIFSVPGSNRGDFNYTGSCGVATIVTAKIQSGCLVYKVSLPVAVAEEQRDEMSQLLTLINFGLLVGGFQMDVRDGELFFLCSHIFEAHLREKVIASSLSIAVSTSNQYLPAAMRLIFEPSLSAAEAYASLNH